MKQSNFFACCMMTLFPVSLLLSIMCLNPSSVGEYFLVLMFSVVIWFLIHSLILWLMVMLYKSK